MHLMMLSKKDRKLYTGYTNNLKARYKDHVSGRVNSTKYRGELELIYFEACINEVDAIRREKYLKSGLGKKFLKSRLKFWYKTSE